MIRIEHLRKEYQGSVPLKDLTTNIRDGEVVAVIGPSGTGKSTLLRCLNGLDKPTDGRIWVDDIEVTAPKCDLGKVRQKMGMVFQSFNLFADLTVIENLMFPAMDLLGLSRQAAYDKGIELLKKVGMAERALRYPDELSGGQKQRAAIARALMMDPEIMLFDEPTSALDPTMIGEVQSVIRELAKSGKTIVIVTHELGFAKAIASRVIFLDDGGIYEEGSPEQIFSDPRRESTRRFVRKLRVLELEIESRYFDLPAALSQIEQYCIRNLIGRKVMSHLQLTFEEMIQNLLLPQLRDPRILVTIEYSDTDDTMTMMIRYNGPYYDLRSAEDHLALAVLSSSVSELRYSIENEGPYTNRAEVIIKK